MKNMRRRKRGRKEVLFPCVYKDDLLFNSLTPYIIEPGSSYNLLNAILSIIKFAIL